MDSNTEFLRSLSCVCDSRWNANWRKPDFCHHYMHYWSLSHWHQADVFARSGPPCCTVWLLQGSGVEPKASKGELKLQFHDGPHAEYANMFLFYFHRAQRKRMDLLKVRQQKEEQAAGDGSDAAAAHDSVVDQPAAMTDFRVWPDLLLGQMPIYLAPMQRIPSGSPLHQFL